MANGRLRLALAALVVVLAGLSACTSSSGHTAVSDGPCPQGDTGKVSVAVGSVVRCVTATDDMTGLKALAAAGFVVREMSEQPGAVCQIDGKPEGASCDRFRPGDYWNYWHTVPGQTTWKYSQLGAGNRNAVGGTAEGWEFGNRVMPSWSPGQTATSHTPPAPTAAGSPASWMPTTVLAVFVFLGCLVAIVVHRTRPNRQASVHPGAWWLWALCGAAVASRTLNPVLLLLLIAVISMVVVLRRPDTAWARYFRVYLMVGALVVAIRIIFRMIFAGAGPTVLLNLPVLQLPSWLTGMRLLGPISVEAVLSALYGGLQLAAIIICFGAANTLANPRRLVGCVPAALYQMSTILVISLSVFPQLAESAVRVRTAQRLRQPEQGSTRRRSGGIVIPVLADALDRAVLLAAGMDSRGFGRRSGPAGKLAGPAALAGICLVMASCYWLLADGRSRWVGAVLLIGGMVCAWLGLRAAGAGIPRTRYRPQRWGRVDTALVVAGVAAILPLFAARSTELHPGTAVLPLMGPATILSVCLLAASVLVTRGQEVAR